MNAKRIEINIMDGYLLINGHLSRTSGYALGRLIKCGLEPEAAQWLLGRIGWYA